MGQIRPGRRRNLTWIHVPRAGTLGSGNRGKDSGPLCTSGANFSPQPSAPSVALGESGVRGLDQLDPVPERVLDV